MSELSKILYVEDDQDVSEIVKISLSEIGGFEVQHFSTGAEGLEALKSFTPDLILLDVMLPDINGLDLFQEIRRQYEQQNFPIIFMTGKSQLHEQEVYQGLGATAVITKPFDPVQLPDRIRALCAGCQRDARSPQKNDKISQIEKNLEGLKVEYVQHSKKILPLLRSVYTQMSEGKGSTESLESILGLVHKLSGSAQMFGLGEVSRKASRIEKKVKVLIGNFENSELVQSFVDDYYEFLEFLEGELRKNLLGLMGDSRQREEKKYGINLFTNSNSVVSAVKYHLETASIRCSRFGSMDELNSLFVLHGKSLPRLLIVEDDGRLNLEEVDVEFPMIVITSREDYSSQKKNVKTLSETYQVRELIDLIQSLVVSLSVKIAIVDDDQFVVDLLEHKFQSLGYQVITASDGNQGLDVLMEFKPQVAIVDIMMPGVDGISILNTIKSSPEHSGINVILLTAKKQLDSVLNGLENGAEDYIFKPFNTDEVVARTLNLLKRIK